MIKPNSESDVTAISKGSTVLIIDRSDQKEAEQYTVFTKSQIIQYITIASLTSMISPLTASIYLPAINQIESVKYHAAVKKLKIITIVFFH